MRRILYIVLVGLTFLAPVQRVKISDLAPVEAVYLLREGEWVTLSADTGTFGRGKDALQALEALRENTPGVVYLDTVKYVVVNEAAEQDLDLLESKLKPTVKVCLWRDGQLPENMLAFLRLRKDLPTLSAYMDRKAAEVDTTPG